MDTSDLQALINTSKNLQSDPIFISICSQSTLTALSHLQTLLDDDDTIKISSDRNLFDLFRLFCYLQTLTRNLEKSQGFSLRSFLDRQITNYKISRIASAIESVIQAYIDRQRIVNLVKALTEQVSDEYRENALTEFEIRLCKGFDRDFQDLVLRAKIFQIFETLLCDSRCSNRVQDQIAVVIVALCRFNRNVFVGLVVMGPTIKALISMASCCSIQVLTSLIRLVRTPLVDEIDSNKQIPNIIGFLSLDDMVVQVAAMECILEIANLGRVEVIQAMVDEGLIKKLVELQRLDMKNSPFASCVSLFAVKLEVGEGLNSKEKTEFKLQVLKKVKESSVSEAETFSIVPEVLWGSSA